jgi:tetratricopeptide (TPR) repeat protein
MGRSLCANYSRLALYFLAFLSMPAPLVLRGQSAREQAAPPAGATLQGVVRDSDHRPVTGASVTLQGKDAPAVTVRTDSAGAYRYSGVREGSYTLRAEMIRYVAATVVPVTLARNESKTIDLTLESEIVSKAQNSSAETPQFFDEPHFTVAGVTDSTNLGGHGSDTIVRNREAVAKVATSMGKQPEIVPKFNASNAAIEQSLRDAVERQPASFAANLQLGKVLVENGKAKEALAYLERASQLIPGDYESAYELALARADTGDYEQARVGIRALLVKQDKSNQEKGEPHHLLAEVSEKLNDPLDAAKEYQRAAELNPSEPYLFDWGAELLLHHAAEPAAEVFTRGNRLFPHSARMLAGLGASWYALGSYDPAAQRLCEASDLSPDDPNPYLLMGRMQAVETTPTEAITERLQRFLRLQPQNALANYNYAISVWKRRRSPDEENFARVKSLLEKAVQLDPTLGLGYLQLGILYSERKDFPNAVVAYQQAITVTPGLEEVHYRLAQIYRQTGQTVNAQAELELYEKLSKEKAAEAERQRHEVQQFVYQLRDSTTSAKPQ